MVRTSMQIGLTLLVLVSLSPNAAASTKEEIAEQVRRVCTEKTPKHDDLPGVTTLVSSSAESDMPFVEAKSERYGATVRIYHDESLRDIAITKAPCLMGLLDLLKPIVVDPRENQRWDALTITVNRNYIPPRGTEEARWVLHLADGKWSENATKFLTSVMPHEQVHVSQRRTNIKLPRWFSEGHATWAGLQVTQHVRADFAMNERKRYAAALEKDAKARLASWGGVVVKPGAIDSQLSQADRERRQVDPTFVPAGPYSFGAGDFIEDNLNEDARYGAAHRLFDGFETRHGSEAVKKWVNAVLETSDKGKIVPLAKEVFGEDISSLLE